MIVNESFRGIIKTSALFAVCILLLLGAALYNGFPILFSDSGTYISSGFSLKVPGDRPIFYGLFIAALSMHKSLWILLFFQSLLVVFSLYHFVKTFYSGKKFEYVFLMIVALLSACSAASIKTSSIMADMFTPLLFITSIALLYRKKAPPITTAILIAIAVYSILVHHSHYLMMTLFFASMLFAKLILKDGFPIKTKRILIGILIIPACYLFTGLINYSIQKEFFISKTTHIFLTAKLIDEGIVEDFLNENCDKKNYVLCPYRDKLLFLDFIWDFQGSPLYKTGSWDNSAVAYNEMIGDIFKSPRHIKMFVIKTVESSFKQFFQFQIDEKNECTPMGIDSPPYGPVRDNFGHQSYEYFYALQQRDRLSFDSINSRQNYLLAFSGMIFLFILAYRKQVESSDKKYQLVFLVLLFVYLNALVCGGLSFVNSRYQTRVEWLIPLVALLLFFELQLWEKAKLLFKPSEK